MPTLAPPPPCKLIRDVSLARVRFSALCLNLTTWFSSRGLLPVTYLLYPSALIALLFTNENVTACQNTRSHKERTENPGHMLYNNLTYSINFFKFYFCHLHYFLCYLCLFGFFLPFPFLFLSLCLSSIFFFSMNKWNI